VRKGRFGMRKSKYILYMVLVLTVTANAVEAGCFRGRPECRTFWITEAGFMYRFDSPGVVDSQSRDFYLANFGLMRNISDRHAVGGLLGVGWDHPTDDWRTYIGVRFRRWLSHSVGADVTVGIIRSARSRQGTNFFSEISMMLSDQVGVATRMEWVSRPDYATASHDVSWYGGVRLGSEFGVVVGAIMLTILALGGDWGPGGMSF
jgi:hypothetical protein